jgi:dienelactone hydrolase
MTRQHVGLLALTLFLGSLGSLSCNKQGTVAHDAIPRAPGSFLFARAHTVVPTVTTDTIRLIDGITVRDAHIASCSPRHDDVHFYVVRPEGNGPFAGIFFFHWLGRPKGNREEFLDEALRFAHEGTVSVLIDGYFPWKEEPTAGPTDKQQVIDQVVDARAVLNVLLHEPGIDSTRIAFVGHDYGAMFGGILSGIESRIKTYVLVAGMGNFGDWSLKYWTGPASAGERAYRDTLDPVDPIHYVAHAAPASLFFQFARTDKYISAETAGAFSGAASSPKEVRSYETTHEMDIPEVGRDRYDWLKREIRIGK